MNQLPREAAVLSAVVAFLLTLFLLTKIGEKVPEKWRYWAICAVTAALAIIVYLSIYFNYFC